MSRFFSRFLYPVEITSGNNTIVLRLKPFVGSGSVSGNVSPGVYYLRDEIGDVEIDEKYPSLFQAIKDSVLEPEDGFFFEWQRPAGYRYRESLSTDFTDSAVDGYVFSDAAFTFPKNLLGFPRDISTDTSPEEDPVIGTRSVLGSWIAGSLEGGDWTSILSREEKEIYSSTDPIYRDTKIIAMREARRPREFRFENVPGLRVEGGSVRGTDISYRELADLAQITDGFADDGDEVSLRQMYNRVNAGQPFLVQYENPRATILEEGLFEGMRLYSIPEHQSLSNWHDEPTPGGELYNVEFTGLVVDGEYDY